MAFLSRVSLVVVVALCAMPHGVWGWGKTTKQLEDRTFLSSVRLKRLRLRGTSAPRERVPECVNVLTPCVKSCVGKVQGLYSSCKGCNYFKSCGGSNGLATIDYDMTCAAGTLWNDRAKTCDWPNMSTCTACTYSNTTVDLRAGVFSQSNPAFTWLEMPVALPRAACDNHGLLKVMAPTCTKKIHLRFLMSALGGPALHIGGDRLVDGYGDLSGGSNFGPDDSELHLNYEQFGAVNSRRGGYRHYWDIIKGPKKGGELEMCIQIELKRNRATKVQIKGGINITLRNRYLLNKRELYIGLNRVISPDPPVRSQGLCVLHVAFTC